MNRIITIVFCLFLFAQVNYAQDTLRVLFLGNSYTASNNLPSLISNIATSQGDVLIYDSNTPGGYTLEGHTTNTTSQNKIAQGDWDYVVLQEQSQKPSFPPTQVAVEVYPFATQLSNDIRTANPCTHPIFFMTWGRENGDQSNCEFYEPLCTYEGMQGRLTESYNEMAMENNAMLSPVGEVWRKFRLAHPDIGLYSGDGSHPGIHGSYLAASTFYSMLFQKTIAEPYFVPNNIETSDAELIRIIVDQTVFDVNNQWDFSDLDVTADASHTISNNALVCISTATNATSHSWDFGDGNSSTDQNPMYEYSTDGPFTVIYTVSNGCNTDTFTFEILVVLSNIEETAEIANAKIYPNPFDNVVIIETTLVGEIEGDIIDITGKTIQNFTFTNGQRIDLAHLPKGIYYLKYEKDGVANVLKLIKK